MSTQVRDGNGITKNVATVADGNGDLVPTHGLMAATATPIAAGAGSVQALAAAAGLKLVGYAVLETAAATAAIQLHHGTDATSGSPLLDVKASLAASGVLRVTFPSPIACAAGIYLERVSGATQLVLYTLSG